jgi:hypothetical protein
MTAPTTDVIAIGNAIVDVMAPASEQQIVDLGLAKGGMTLVDPAARANFTPPWAPRAKFRAAARPTRWRAWRSWARPAPSSARWR